jgi:hypothetical protein
MDAPERKRPKIKKHAIQRDLFTGELITKKIKRGRGRHIKLKQGEDRVMTVVPGMAHFAGTGPERTYCFGCKFWGDLPVYKGGKYVANTTAAPRRFELGACRKAADLFGGKVQRGGIGGNPSCKFFEAFLDGLAPIEGEDG